MKNYFNLILVALEVRFRRPISILWRLKLTQNGQNNQKTGHEGLETHLKRIIGANYRCMGHFHKNWKPSLTKNGGS